MASHFKIPLLNPFKFIPAEDVDRNIHFDGNWACEQIKKWEFRTFYQQKWKTSDKTKIQIESSIAPNPLLLIDKTQSTIATFNWTSVVAATGYQIYETEIDFTGINDGVYFLYQIVTFGAITWAAISEPINLRANWPSTLLFRYKNSFNDADVAFTSGIEFKFRVEGAIPAQETQFKRGGIEYVNQSVNVSLLKGFPNRVLLLCIGGTDRDFGVAPWVLDLLNRIFDCDTVYIEDRRYAANVEADIKPIINKAYPLVGATLEIVESFGASSLEFADTAPLGAGIVIGYEFETNVFGPGSLVPIIEVEENE